MSESQSAAGGSTARKATGTLQLVREAAQQGAADAHEAAAKTLAATSQCVGRCIYAASYAVAYGVVFPAALIAVAIPRNNVTVRGLIDGASAAKHRVHEMRGTSAGTGGALAAG
jgi:hypothetical protein